MDHFRIDLLQGIYSQCPDTIICGEFITTLFTYFLVFHFVLFFLQQQQKRKILAARDTHFILILDRESNQIKRVIFFLVFERNKQQ